MRVAPKFPDNLKGEMLKYGGGNITQQRQWTTQEINWCLDLKQKGYTSNEIALSTDRTLTSVKFEVKKNNENRQNI